ncbi:MAG: substrate-binding domain-containing protein, partial [Vallitaleaceae bacterium]|nr:substrate-binding domain-containing protein [Vallitaleaceae bacterium]
MNGKNNSVRAIIILGVIGVLVFAIIYGGISATKNVGKSKTAVTAEKAIKTMNKLYDDIDVSTETPRKVPVSLEAASVKEALPEISKYPAQVENTTDTYIEIFSSTEKAGEGKDGWLIDMANAFNSSGAQVGGQTASVRIRGIASGTGTDYITSGKYLPDAFTPSNELWGKMIEAQGTKINLVEDRLTGNVAGVLMSKTKYNELLDKYGSINLKNITEAVAANEIAMGYTNPFASSTGLNFLVSTLYTFDEKDPLSVQAIQGFETFQTNIPFVAYTTLQMRDSASSGVLDGFIMEYQTFNNSADLKADYIFTPFGVRHDSPVYEIGDLTAEKKEILKQFIAFCGTKQSQALASEDGFNFLDEYKPEIGDISGDTITQAQKLWKEKKNGTNDIVAVFVADVSGSMEGEPMNKLKESLL